MDNMQPAPTPITPAKPIYRNKVVIVAVIVLVLLGAAAIYFFAPKAVKKTAQETKKTTAPAISPAPALKQADLMSQLPYKTDAFIAEYFPTSRYYSFRLKGTTYEEIKKNRDAAYSWIKNMDGFKNNEFCAFKYNIFFQNLNDSQKTEELTVFPACK